jgi:hypothetical protein
MTEHRDSKSKLDMICRDTEKANQTQLSIPRRIESGSLAETQDTGRGICENRRAEPTRSKVKIETTRFDRKRIEVRRRNGKQFRRREEARARRRPPRR